MLDCSHNELEELTSSALQLNCSYNHLKSLNTGGGWSATLDCSHNELTSLEFTGGVGVAELICDDNQLTVLDLGTAAPVKKISARNNQLRCIDLRNATFLESCELDDSTIIIDAEHGLKWREQNGNTYYIEELGVWPRYTRVVTGWREIDGTEYFFTPEGVLVEDAIRLNDVRIRQTELELTPWDTETLTAITNPADFPTDSLVWSSEDESIAVVDKTGTVTPVSTGTTFITVSSVYDDSVSYTLRVTVRDLLSFETLQMDLIPDEHHQFYVKESTSLVTGISWEIKDPGIAKISEEGEVTALSEGVTELVIHVTGSGGRKETYTIPITVTALDSVDLNVDRIEFRQMETLTWPSEMECVVDQVINIDVMVYVSDPLSGQETSYLLTYDNPVAGTGAGFIRLIWSSTNPEVASVTKGRVEIRSKGTAFITAQVLGLNVSSMMDLTANGKPVPLRSIALSESVYPMNVGASKTFAYTLSPRNVDEDQKKILWKTSDPEVATVDANGRVTAVGSGMAEIEAYSAVDDNIYSSVQIYVQSPVESITMEEIEIQESDVGFEVVRKISDGDVISLKHGIEKNLMISAYVNESADKKLLAYELDPEDGSLSVEQIEFDSEEIPDGRNFFRITADQVGETKVFIRSTDGSGIYGSFTVKILPYNEWITEADGTKRHFTEDVMDTGWKQIDGKKYYFSAKGVLQTGWKEIDKKWYYFGKDGVTRTGWQKIGKWYFFGADGVMKTGWQKSGGKWYYLGTDGIMRTGWQKIGKSWYYFGADGIMRTGWQKVGKNWYFFSNGVMKTGWLRSGGFWYYFDSRGVMVTGNRKIGTKIYQFSSAGICLNP
ncbi:MAG: Ig-like domain-containing protein [Eubacterium sp.]|nr:Ig-like domain-containing protein [Eubacterium sp.]